MSCAFSTWHKRGIVAVGSDRGDMLRLPRLRGQVVKVMAGGFPAAILFQKSSGAELFEHFCRRYGCIHPDFTHPNSYARANDCGIESVAGVHFELNARMIQYMVGAIKAHERGQHFFVPDTKSDFCQKIHKPSTGAEGALFFELQGKVYFY